MNWLRKGYNDGQKLTGSINAGNFLVTISSSRKVLYYGVRMGVRNIRKNVNQDSKKILL